MLKPIPNCDGYFVDELGNIYSNKAKGGAIRKLKPSPRGNSQRHKHLRVTIEGKDHMVHRLVYIAFFGEVPEGKIICHRDDDATNNTPENLYAGTYSTNAKDGFTNGRERSRKLTEVQAKEILELKGKMKNKDVANIFNINKSTVSDIWNGRTWRNIHD